MTERGKHVPRIQVHEGCDEVETEGGQQGNDDDTTAAITASEETLEEIIHAVGIERRARDTTDSQVHRQTDQVRVDNTENDERYHVSDLGSLWSVTQCQDELDKEESQVEVLQDCVDDRSCRVAKWPAVMFSRGIRSCCWVSNKVHNYSSGEPERCQHEPRQENGEHIVDQLNVEEEHADKIVTTLVPVKVSFRSNTKCDAQLTFCRNA